MYTRTLTDKLRELKEMFPVVALMGPRQSGKTTLVKAAYPDLPYVNLENPADRNLAISDPPYFLKSFKANGGLIIDEVQYAPELLSYIQVDVDASHKEGEYILTGSQNLTMHEQISQSLAGRVAFLNLLPLSFSELSAADLLPEDPASLIWKGFYPRIWMKNLSPYDWYASYITSYLERDVRKLKNIGDLATFQRFMGLCAGRIGQVINLSELGRDCGVSYHTAKSWISVLEASYVIFQLQPHYNNFSKRLTKAPKLYFYDTGLACSLLNIESEKQLSTHYLYGNLFESMILSELIKKRYNHGKKPQCYFWRDQKNHEVDCLLERGQELIPIEIKSSTTISPDFFKGLRYWCNLAEKNPEGAYLIYGGETDQSWRHGKVLSWHSIAETHTFD